MNRFQFTFFDKKGKLKPVACILETQCNFVEVVKMEDDFRNQAIIKICTKRGWTAKEMVQKYEYTRMKYVRIKEVK